MRHTTQGFTLLELLTVISIVAILAAIGVPSFSQIITQNRVSAAATSLQLALVKARSEAVKRNGTVTLSPNSGGWGYGWQLRDTGGNVLASEDALKGITVTSGTASVSYLSSGRVSGVAPSFEVAASREPTVRRCVSADLSGRPYVAEGQC